jgi:pimeloyl-ACP methyl ester carboxylesterase
MGMPGALKLERVREANDLVRRRPQTPVRPYPYREEEVRYGNPAAKGRVTLAGTLTIPQGPGPFPAAMLIAGSGNLDRDENVAGHKLFLVLADFLTRRGIAVLRADKRGAGESSGDSAKALTADYASDVQAGVAFLRIRPEVDAHRIGLVGHSEGGVIAPLVAAKDRDIAFAVLMAAPGVPGEELVAEQTQASMELNGFDSAIAAHWGDITRLLVVALKLSPDLAAAKNALKAKLGDGYSDAMADTLIARLTATPWLRAFLDIDPRVALRAVACPVLAINGSKDRQVPAGPNLAGIRQALQEGKNPHFEVEEMPGLNHLFQTAETGAPREYGHIEETMSPVALDRMAAWIVAASRAQ